MRLFKTAIFASKKFFRKIADVLDKNINSKNRLDYGISNTVARAKKKRGFSALHTLPTID